MNMARKLFNGLSLFGLIFFQAFWGNHSAFAQDALCAEVKIEIKQKLSLERQAFDAHMRITNGLDTLAIENVKATLHFEDAKGNVVTATSDPNNTTAEFFARVDSLANIGNIEGTGRVAAKTVADIHWLIIPAQGTGGVEPDGKLYYVGATLDYILNGEESSVDVTPDYIVVKPQPLLDLDYFLAGEVYADDAFTPEIEPPIPFTLGVRMKNVGGGAANKVSIESAQPKIVENKQGLLIDFKIIDSYVSDQPAGKTLLIDFGDIASNTAKVGRWNMITTLSGKFVEIDASYTHADSLGGALTSLIRNINSYLLVHDVKVDLPGRDNIRDFLAYSGDVLRVFESDGVDFSVTDQSRSANLQSNGGVYQLNFPATNGFVYARTKDPYFGKKTLSMLKRSDGKILPAENFWLSQIRDENNNWQYFINVFDANTTGRYTFNFSDGTTANISGRVFHDVNNNGAKDDGEPGLGNVKISLQGVDQKGAAVSTSGHTDADGNYKFISLNPGVYQIKVDEIDGYINGARIIGSLGGKASEEDESVIRDVSLIVGADATDYLFAKRKPITPTEGADVGISVIADKITVRAEDEVTFTITTSNVGPENAKDVAVRYLLPEELSLIEAIPSIGSYSNGIWTIGTTGKGEKDQLALRVKVNSIKTEITNIFTITSSTLDSAIGNNQAQITLLSESNDLSVESNLAKEARILMLVSCFDGNGDDDKNCSELRSNWSRTILSERGYITHAVTTTNDFRDALRSSHYNVYWINGGAVKLTSPLVDELRMAVLRGDSLVIDGSRDYAVSAFDAISGVTSSEQIIGSQASITVDNEIFIPEGNIWALSPHGASVLASYDEGGAALVQAVYGNGKVLSAGFDILSTMRNLKGRSASEFFNRVVSNVTPEVPESFIEGEYLSAQVTVTMPELDAPEDIELVIDVPYGVRLIDASPAPSTIAGNKVSWTKTMSSNEVLSIRFGTKLPTAKNLERVVYSFTASYDGQQIVENLNVEVISVNNAFIENIIEEAQGQGGDLKEHLDGAQTAYVSENYADTISALTVADQISTKPITDELRLQIAQWLRSAELLWRDQPAVPVTPSSIVAYSGTPQTALIGSAFDKPLQAKVLGQNSTPVEGVLVKFALSGEDASAHFADEDRTALSITNAQGIATSPRLIANLFAGGYSAVATVDGLAGSAVFNLTNQAVPPSVSSIEAVKGTPQVTLVNTVFSEKLEAMVRDESDSPLAGVWVRFSLPENGASAEFASGGKHTMVATGADGIAVAPALTANGITGNYQVVASVEGLESEAGFSLTNNAPIAVPAKIVPTAGALQKANVNAYFAEVLSARVTDASNQPVAGIPVQFKLPVNGASAVFADGSIMLVAITNEDGVASSSLIKANAIIGQYQATAEVVGISEKVIYTLENISEQTIVVGSISAESGTPQKTKVQTVFMQPLKAKVLDTDGKPFPGIPVTFALPESGASAYFTNNTHILTILTDSQGIATSTLTANNIVGNYTAIAKVDGLSNPATFNLTNEAAEGGSTVQHMIAYGGTPQNAIINTPFVAPLTALVFDDDNQPLQDAEVTFMLPTNGASAFFEGGITSVTVKTDDGGLAISMPFTANDIVGAYEAIARVEGSENIVSFSLTNNPVPVIPVSSISAHNGTPQTSTVGTRFAQPLEAIVKNQNGDPMAGVVVEFILPSGQGASATFVGNRYTAVVQTDVDGLAVSPILLANATAGVYIATANVEGLDHAAEFNLTNIEASGRTSATFVGSAATGTGTVTASISGGGDACAFDLDKTRVAKPSGLMARLLGKYLLPHGVLEFELVDCNVGSTVTVTTTWPSLKGITGYMKYGPTPYLPWISTWYMPNNLKISGNTVSYIITDGKLGDDDLKANGVIRDPGGPVVLASQPAVQIPVQSNFGRALLIILIALSGLVMLRRRWLAAKF
ncbi:MAG: DUF11 domain-containing protein [Burkholderiales bacterium]|nr:DUF11 domain-containing protein [Burkholderiales bacterium]